MGTATALIGKSEKILTGLLGLGLLGVLYLVIFGNLSGNLGWTAESVTITNESGAYINLTGYTLDGASDTGAASFTITSAWNYTNGSLIIASNYAVSSVGVLSNATATSWGDVNLTYTYTRDSTSNIQSEQTISNLTGGVVTFFSFSGTLFTLTAITLLIGIILVVIGLVKSGRGGSSGRGSAAERLTN